VVVPSPPPPPQPPAAKPRKNVGAKPSTRKPNGKKGVERKPTAEQAIQPTLEDPAPTRVVPTPTPTPAPAAANQSRDLMTSPLVRVLLMSAALLALLTMLVAALPLAALERITENHWRTEHVATFVDGHRLDLVVGGVATLLVALVVALPTVAG
jgi:hypothetical protein